MLRLKKYKKKYSAYIGVARNFDGGRGGGTKHKSTEVFARKKWGRSREKSLKIEDEICLLCPQCCEEWGTNGAMSTENDRFGFIFGYHILHCYRLCELLCKVST